MDIKVTPKMIKELCGTVSFKRGDSFYKADKVTFHEHTDQFCKAVVQSTEDFHVHIEKDEISGFNASCSCPKLANFSMSCQHIAAVLIALYEQRKQGILPANIQSENATNQGISEEFMTLFQDKSSRTTGHQRHFEKRQVLDVHFTLKPLLLGNNQYFWGIEVEVAKTKVRAIREFLQAVQQGQRYTISSTLQYDRTLHCFPNESDRVIHQLIQIAHDERMYLEAFPPGEVYVSSSEILLIPPIAWQGVYPLLLHTPFFSTGQDGQMYNSPQQVEGPPPLEFSLKEGDRGDYQLTIQGFEKMIVLNAYHSVFSEGTIYKLHQQDCERLVELKALAPTTNQISIPQAQIEFFMNKIVPGLKKIGQVSLSQSLTQEMSTTPLVAKLYLDRLKNRLLAGLEFQYNQFVIQPLENRDIPEGPMLVRDIQKEETILSLMDECGFTKTDGGYFMQNEDLEYHFLYHILPKLQQLTQIYATTAIRLRIVKENNFPKIRVKVQKERTNWLEFKFEMDGIADKHIRQILEALEVKQKYYRLPNGSLLSLETREMEEIQRFLQAGPIQNDHYEATFNMPITESLKFLDVMNDSDVYSPEESFRQFSTQLLHPEQLDFEVPPSLQQVLRDYQKQGYKWMKLLASYGFGGVLADDMGLGKTLQSIAFIVAELANIRERQQPVLIVCPSSLTYNWLHEMMRFAPELQAIVIDGTAKERRALLQDFTGIDVLITSYPLLRRDLSYYENQAFHTVFFDEAQAFKNPVTQTARAVKNIKADNRFGLTGTPMENSLEELWAIYRVVFPQLFQGLDEFNNLTRKDIARRVRPFLLRRMKEDVLAELPGKQQSLELSELLPEQKQLYAAYLAKLREDTLKHLDKETFRKNRIRILAGITRLRQICCHPALFVEGYKGSSAKFEQLLQILEESRLSGRRVLIFSQFTKMLQFIAKEMTVRGQSYFYLDGQTPSEERVELCNRFNEGEEDVFLISLKAGGTGLNLIGADTVILYDLWWNPAVEEQAADRAYRMGQKNVVQVIKLIARGTIEEKINALQDKKRDLIADILQADETASKTLTEEDIREILLL